MKRSKNRKEEIYAVSAKLFRKRGYVASTMRDIAELVGIEPSSLYSHIKSKEEILIKICMTCAQEFDDGMVRVIQSNKGIHQKIEDLIDLHLDIALNKPSSVTVFNDEWKHLPEKELNEFMVIRSEYASNFKEILMIGIKKGEIVSMSESTAFQLIINSVKWLHFYVKKLSEAELREKRKEIKQFIIRGLFL
ncbi:MAG: TetR/AcrR family transcriptional regulator [Saprospiraceae bacterium]|nr:TetR/AcrR family transcriptional regulator [Saprospiraceae bacterium]